MSAMYRLKAYFGMVPADEMDFVDDHEPYAGSRYGFGGADRSRGDRWTPGGGRFGDQNDYGEYTNDTSEITDDGWDNRLSREAPRPPRGMWEGIRAEREVPTPSGHSAAGFGGGPATAVRGSLAMDPDKSVTPSRSDRPLAAAPSSAPRASAAPAPSGVPSAVPEQRDRTAPGPATITTLHPRSYNEARTIGERYRDGVPVIMNLTELDDAAAKRLVDFAAGLAFALRGSIDKVTNRVFLLTPADVDVSADDARRIAERGGFRQD